jgi:hypothetical protein
MLNLLIGLLLAAWVVLCLTRLASESHERRE